MSSVRKAMVIADSAETRSQLRRRVYEHGDMEVVATSPRGELAVHRLVRCNPDIVVVSADLDGEVLNELAERLRARRPGLLVMMFDVDAPADSGRFETRSDALQRRSTRQMPAAFDTHHGTERSTPARITDHMADQPADIPDDSFHRRRTTMISGDPVEAVVIGVSTGGPPALSKVLPCLPDDFPPVYVVQHVMPEFVPQLVERLDRDCDLPVREARHGETSAPSTCWFAPGDRHLRVRRVDGRIAFDIDDGPPVQSSRPSVDVLFESAATVFGGRTLAVVMTGMGQDGLAGCRAIHRAGGHIIVQDRESSAVWGMPGAVAEAGIANEVVSLDVLGWTIAQRVASSRRNGTIRTLRDGGK